MQSSARQVILSIGLSAVSLSGCYSPYGYQSPYGPGYYTQPPYQTPQYPGSPVYNGPQGPALGPGGTYVPGTTNPGTGSPTPLTNPPNTYDNSGNGINWEPPNNNAPPFNPNPGGTPSGGNRGTVPDPVDDFPPSANRPGLEPTSNARDDLQSPFGDSSDLGTPSQPARVSSEPDLFEPPLQLNSEMTSGAAAIQTVSLELPENGKLNPFGRDTKHANPTWLRGVIDYDARDRSWSIVYAADPDPRDPNGGSLTLANHPSLSRCRNGDVVLVEGAINASLADTRGKPIYALDKVTQLTAQ